MSVNGSGEVEIVQSLTGWRTSWSSIITGNFSSSQNDDLLLYDNRAGIGEFSTVSNDASITPLRVHSNWRNTWQHIVSGRFVPNASFESLLLYEERSGLTEFYSTDGQGSISRIDVNLGKQWSSPWQFILSGQFVPGRGSAGTSSLCAYRSDGTVSYFFVSSTKEEPMDDSIDTVLRVHGIWAAGDRTVTIHQNRNSLVVMMSAFGRPNASGSVLNSNTIKVTFPDDQTLTGTLERPDRIRWSNGTVWKRVGDVEG